MLQDQASGPSVITFTLSSGKAAPATIIIGRKWSGVGTESFASECDA